MACEGCDGNGRISGLICESCGGTADLEGMRMLRAYQLGREDEREAIFKLLGGTYGAVPVKGLDALRAEVVGVELESLQHATKLDRIPLKAFDLLLERTRVRRVGDRAYLEELNP